MRIYYVDAVFVFPVCFKQLSFAKVIRIVQYYTLLVYKCRILWKRLFPIFYDKKRFVKKNILLHVIFYAFFHA